MASDQDAGRQCLSHDRFPSICIAFHASWHDHFPLYLQVFTLFGVISTVGSSITSGNKGIVLFLHEWVLEWRGRPTFVLLVFHHVFFPAAADLLFEARKNDLSC